MFGHRYLKPTKVVVMTLTVVSAWAISVLIATYSYRDTSYKLVATFVILSAMSFFTSLMWGSRANWIIYGVFGLVTPVAIQTLGGYFYEELSSSVLTTLAGIPLWGLTGVFITKVIMAIHSWTEPWKFNKAYLEALSKHDREVTPEDL